MKEELISFETAKLAKEKNFNVPCDYAYEFSLTERIDEETNDTTGAFGWKKNELVLNKGWFMNNYSAIDFTNNNWLLCAAPTQALLQKWLREIHHIVVTPTTDFVTWECNIIHPDYDDELILNKDDCGNWFSTYEEALEAGLQEALKQIL